jgi:hypothetical protein
VAIENHPSGVEPFKGHRLKLISKMVPENRIVIRLISSGTHPKGDHVCVTMVAR